MSSLIARGARLYARRSMKTTEREPEAVVQHFRRLLDRAPTLARIPKGVARRPVEPGELGSVRGEWVGVPAASRAVLHHHGGAYVSGTPKAYASLGARLAKHLRADVLLAEYRLAPEHRCPAALDDAVASYRALIERYDPSRVALTGDSAGGGLTLALLQRLKREGDPLPGAAVLLSPWADLSDEAKSREINAEADDMLSRETLVGAAEAYLAGADPHDPQASPVFGSFEGLPPLLVCVDESEILLDDSTRIVEAAEAAGAEARLIRSSGLFHVWPALVPMLREARETVDEMAEFLDARLAG